ncbi:type I-E CRISPR-associated protein Cas6/Cse3/CasE [Spirosoma panaciterrae]|uniref:type I-E CRISPR-associated protein Cas6/Cse3/CasE n=1 Tax=Spirosoma panaciterrae TaxID=496058 RepID=UPI00037E75CC|nr:type I-E CRISPR-associated protein Cas6/Cse3/CasE [Spirosoma panaciterrae]
MYLSKLTLNPRCREALRDVSSPYELHRTLSHAFQTESGVDYRAQHGVLFRLESVGYGAALPTVLVQSLTEPNWNELPEAYFLNRPELKPISPAFSVGQTLAFRLVANPTKKEKREGKSQGRRVALLNIEQEDGSTPANVWLRRKGEQHGFQVLYATTDDFWLGADRRSQGKNAIPLYGVRFDGLLQVSQPNLLQQALISGIGPAKAFGFGLISVARPQ